MANINLYENLGPLLNTQIDDNFKNLNSDKLEKDGSNLATKISFDTTSELTPSTGQMVWDAETGTVDIGLNGATAPVISVGEDQFYRVINQSGTTITKGTLVMAAGTVGNSGLIKVLPWNGSQPSKTIMGLVLADIPTENDPTEPGLGYVLAFGKMKGVQTNGANYSETWANGDILYAGPSGGLTKTMPAAPKTKTTVAIVVNAAANNGTLFVRPTFGSNLAEDELVQIASLAGGDVLSYDATDGRFENKTLASAGILAASQGAASELTLNDGYTEEVFAISDGSTVNLDPNNGSIQTWTLGAGRTPGQANWASGQSIVLQVDDGSDYTIDWTTLAPVWKTDGGVAPTLNTTGVTVIVLWKVSTTIYGARVGDA